MPGKRKTAREKLAIARAPEVKETPTGLMLIPRPLDVDALIRRIEPGKLATVTQIRDHLAKKHHADYTCPMTTGIFMRIAAEAAEEDLLEGKSQITPYWRVIKKDGSLHPRFPGGAEAQVDRLISEGHTIEAGKGKKPPKVNEFEKTLQVL